MVLLLSFIAIILSAHFFCRVQSNPAYNQLLKEARQVQDRQERNRLYAETELIPADDILIAPIYWNSNNYLIKPDLRDVSYTNPEGRIYAWEVYRLKQ